MREPIVLEGKRLTLDITEYNYRGAKESDYSMLITSPTVIFDTGEQKVKIVYLELDDACSDIVSALKSVNYEAVSRTSGMRSTSKVIGYNPRVTLRRDYCTTSSLSNENPHAHTIITGYAHKIAQYYQQYNTELYEKHRQMVDKVLPDWRLEESVFTSGIINKNNPLLYHFDTGNFKAVWSNMLVFKKDIKGGYLAVPEYDVGFELKNNSLLMFDGQNILHGVTPIHKLNEGAYRFSIVYYSLQQMWHCLPPGEELQRIRKLRTEREERRSAGLTAEDVKGHGRSRQKRGKQ